MFHEGAIMAPHVMLYIRPLMVHDKLIMIHEWLMVLFARRPMALSSAYAFQCNDAMTYAHLDGLTE